MSNSFDFETKHLLSSVNLAQGWLASQGPSGTTVTRFDLQSNELDKKIAFRTSAAPT
jgi:hypothetical protein